MSFDPAIVEKLAADYGDAEDCDVLLFAGSIDEDAYRRLKDAVPANRRKNALMILSTWGGDAHAAYRIGRRLQRRYDKLSIFVPGPCKSAGTLLAIGGHELIMGEDGELGPIDVQQMRQDDIWERTSGLIESSALESLGQVTWDLFERLVAEIKDMSIGRVTFKTAADAAAPIVTGVLSPIAAQIDPLKVGETARALQIASQYARLLDETSQNLLDMAVQRLATRYPDHGFIIDREEAGTLFRNVAEPSELLQSLEDHLGALDPGRSAIIFLNRMPDSETPEQESGSGVENEANRTAQANQRSSSTEGGSASTEKDATANGGDGTEVISAG